MSEWTSEYLRDTTSVDIAHNERLYHGINDFAVNSMTWWLGCDECPYRFHQITGYWPYLIEWPKGLTSTEGQ